MFGIEILEVVIGLVFIFLLLSLLATAINEIVMTWLYSRGQNLYVALQTMLDDEADVLCRRFFDHPLIRKLKKRGSRNFPSYISQPYFAKVLTELLCRGERVTLEAVQQGVEALPAGSDTRHVLLGFVHDAAGSLDRFKESLELWYQEVMNQASGWYKKKVQRVLFVLGLLISVVLNANTFQMAHKLSIDPEARREVIEQAYRYMEREETGRRRDSSHDGLRQQIRQLIDEELAMAATALGTGWEQVPALNPASRAWWLYMGQSLLGWTVTALAITLGAPFWFDLLNRVMNIREAARKPSDKQQ